MLQRIIKNIPIYKQDLHEKGLFFSIIDRLRRFSSFNRLYNFLKPSSLNFNGFKLYIDKEDTVVSEYLLRYKKWEVVELSLFKRCLRAGDTVIDLGAHIGTYSLTASAAVGKKGKVYAFEPSPRNFAILSQNIHCNRLRNILPVNQAVSDKKGFLNLYLEKENTGDNRIYSSSNYSRKVKVRTTTLDDFFKQKNQLINIIKMDIQGAEVLALRGASELLKKNKDLIIFTEFWPAGLKMVGASAAALIKILTAAKLEFYEIDEAQKTITHISATRLLKKYPANSMATTDLVCARKGNKRLAALAKLSRFKSEK